MQGNTIAFMPTKKRGGGREPGTSSFSLCHHSMVALNPSHSTFTILSPPNLARSHVIYFLPPGTWLFVKQSNIFSYSIKISALSSNSQLPCNNLCLCVTLKTLFKFSKYPFGKHLLSCGSA